MAIYLLLYHGDDLPSDTGERQAVIEDWDRWNREIGNSLLDGGNQIKKAKCVTSTSTELPKEDGVTAYTIIEAEDIDEAVELSRGAPPLHDGGRADVYKILETAS